MTQDTLKKIGHLVTLYAGIKIREQDYDLFGSKVQARLKLLKLSSLEEYYQLLIKATEMKNVFLGYQEESNLNSYEQEWRDLLASITITETYFLRDYSQFKVLREQVLPEILERKQKMIRLGDYPTLRIWSAGCSTGEELYSIAILLEELRFPWDKWKCLLIGTDINHTVLEVARKGQYSNWSFRQINQDLQKKYFKHRFQTWGIDRFLKDKVTFQAGNLLHDEFPTQDGMLHNFDIILCRNVFIYFEFQAIAHVLDKFYKSLAPMGYLVAGHTELYGQDLKRFWIRNFSDAIVYQRPDITIPDLAPPTAPALRTSVQTAVPVQMSSEGSASSPSTDPLEAELMELKNLLELRQYDKVLERSYRLLQDSPQCFELYVLAAESHANLGDHQKAKASCWRALEIQPFASKPYFILTHIAEEEGDLLASKEFLKKIIYFDPTAVSAYLELSSIYAREKDLEKSKKMKSSALQVLQKLPLSVKQSQAYLGTPLDQLEQYLKNESVPLRTLAG